jgi:HD-GYP domain-containing protein (c-di-GMP phosphodiesterase class II)
MLVAKEIRDTRQWLLLRSGIRLTASQIQLLKQKEVEGIHVGFEQKVEHKPSFAPEVQCQAALQKCLQEFQKQYTGQQIQVEPGLFHGAAEVLLREVLQNPATITTALEMYQWNKQLFQHAVNTAMLAVFVAQRLGLEQGECHTMALGMFFHDFGNTRLPKEIYEKPAGLSNEEREVIKRHVTVGYEFLTGYGIIDEAAGQIVLHHHERLDGSGYPHGLASNALSFEMRIAAVVEVFDAMVSPGTYGRPVPPEQAIRQILQQAGTLYDSDVACNLAAFVPIYPVGHSIILNTGECGMVAESVLGGTLRPTVRIYYAADGRRVPPFEVDLQQVMDKYIARSASSMQEVKGHSMPESFTDMLRQCA